MNWLTYSDPLAFSRHTNPKRSRARAHPGARVTHTEVAP
jgi:hypothetical protein